MGKLVLMLSALLIFISMSENISAQEQENPVLVVSFQKVKMADIEAANKLTNEKFAPILNKLVDEKMLNSWGHFNHAWGDEWNFNIWYVVKDMNAFNAFWDEYMKRLDGLADEWAELRGYIQEHKDKIYTIMNQYPMPPKN